MTEWIRSCRAADLLAGWVMKVRYNVAATFWVNASRVIPLLTIGNVKNPSIFRSFNEKRKKK